MSVIIIGAGGHAKVVADILEISHVPILGLLDDSAAAQGTTRFGYSVLGPIDRYQEYEPSGIIIGVGSNKARSEIVARLGSGASSLWVNAIHPTATVARSAKIGFGVVIAAHAVVNPYTFIGSHVIINTAATVDHDCQVSDFVHIGPGSHLAGEIKIGEGTLVGIGASVAPRVQIGIWTVVGAGAVVVRSIPDQVTAVGVPAHW